MFKHKEESSMLLKLNANIHIQYIYLNTFIDVLVNAKTRPIIIIKLFYDRQLN